MQLDRRPILVAAPGGGSPGSITMIDRLGSPGYSASDFTATFNGTSAATPPVSGIVALMLEANPALDNDFIEITVDITHTFRSDLVITPISPSGVVSPLLDRPTAVTASNMWVLYSRDNLRWTFGSAQHRGENSVGSWTVSIADVESADTGLPNSWTRRPYGDAPASDNAYIYTEEFNESVTRDAARAT